MSVNHASKRLPARVVACGVVGAVLGFVILWWGPAFLWDWGNLGPMVGMLFGGPLGCLIGIVVGAFWERTRNLHSR